MKSAYERNDEIDTTETSSAPIPVGGRGIGGIQRTYQAIFRFITRVV